MSMHVADLHVGRSVHVCQWPAARLPQSAPLISKRQHKRCRQSGKCDVRAVAEIATSPAKTVTFTVHVNDLLCWRLLLISLVHRRISTARAHGLVSMDSKLPPP